MEKDTTEIYYQLEFLDKNSRRWKLSNALKLTDYHKAIDVFDYLQARMNTSIRLVQFIGHTLQRVISVRIIK